MKMKRKRKPHISVSHYEFSPGTTNSQYCAVVNCSNNRHKYPPISLFRFPLDPERCKLWVTKAGRIDLLDKDPNYLYSNCRMCSVHFEDNMFSNIYKSRLQPGAVPTLFNIPEAGGTEIVPSSVAFPETESEYNSTENKQIDSPITLKLECSKDSLSPSQINARKKKASDLHLLQVAIQAVSLRLQTSDQQPVANGLPPNLLGGLPTIPSLDALQQIPQANGTATPSGFLQYILQNNATVSPTPIAPLTVSSISKPKQKKGIKLASPNTVLNQNGLSALNKQNIPISASSVPQQQSQGPTLTQSLRATRKSTGSLPPPRINLSTLDAEPEIEVIQETRSTKGSNAFTPASSTRALQPKPLNNVILLNIAVRPRNLAAVSVNSNQRKDLDGKVKNVLMKTPSEFVEWLLQQGLIRPQQYCNIHKGSNRQPTKLKLGVFSDPKVLTSSGGYVWIGECCGRKYVSVYSGSIFGSTPIDRVSPTSLLKLVYHWACQTSISNVETWVKVDKLFISKIYHYLRCICSVILHDKVYDFGFEFTKVELGIVSLGTTTADGSRKAVKVEILGLYDRKMKSYRLFASTPEPGNTSKERFMRILKPIMQVIHKNAVIVCDQSVDPSCLHSMNYSKVEVCTSSDNESDLSSNATIMFYLRKHVPKMFQAALSQLTENQVQLILDELCWREKFAPTALRCYENIIENIFYITSRELENPGVLPLLEYVADNPHNNWRYKSQSIPKVAPSVPASVILPPTSGPPNVVPTQYTDAAPNPILHPNKVLARNLSESTSHSSVPQLNFNNPLSFNLNKSSNLLTNIVYSLDKPIEASSNRLPGDYKDLEPYFYSRYKGNPNFGTELSNTQFFCHVCSGSYSDNVTFYSHLKFHLERKPVEKDKVDLVCPYCTLSFDNINALNKHKIDNHLMSDLTQIWCRICAEKFGNEQLLKAHMTKNHVEAEMPYRCEVCKFATSFYYEAINHFTKSHKGTAYVQCHFCLNVKTVTADTAYSFSTVIMSHLEKHAASKNPCSSCLLVFHNKPSLEIHRKDHMSGANSSGLVRYESPKGYRVLQFKPIVGAVKNVPVVPAAPTTLTPEPPKASSPAPTPSRTQTAASTVVQDQSDLRFDIGDDKYYCLECDAPISMGTPHLRKYRKCTRCPYTTSCHSTMLKHSQIFHPPTSNKPIPYMLGQPVILPHLMFCPCGFSTLSGHYLARHLVNCGQPTAYPANYSEYMQSITQSGNEMMDLDFDAPMLPLAVELQEDPQP